MGQFALHLHHKFSIDLSGHVADLVHVGMGFFCGQNFECEYIDVLLNKLLLCVIIQN